jgi:tripartite-type tricarboxylate transporter receptor subunit TctC
MSLVAAAGLFALPAHADYPEAPINFIVPYSPGGGTDIGVRTWQPYMEECLGGTIVVQNRPGGGAIVGMAELAKAAPDGYTLGGTNTPNVYTTYISGDVPWTLDSFVFLGTLVGGRSTIVVRQDSPLQSVADLVEMAKEKDGAINVGMSALGGDDHFMLIQVSKATGLDFTFIPMNDSPTVRNALMGSHIDITAMSHAEAATLKEQGHEVVSGSNHVISAPKGIPAEVEEKWSSCLQQVARNPDFVADARKRSVPLVIMNADETRDYIAKDEGFLRALWAEDPWIKK